MSLALMRFDSEREAIEVARRLSLAPRCRHYRWTLDEHGIARWDRMCGGRGRRGRVPPCLCASATDVHPDCPHVTWQTVAVIRLADGSVVLGVEDPDRHGETRFRARATPNGRDREEAVGVWSAREERRAALRPTDPPPDERRPR